MIGGAPSAQPLQLVRSVAAWSGHRSTPAPPLTVSNPPPPKQDVPPTFSEDHIGSWARVDDISSSGRLDGVVPQSGTDHVNIL